MVHSQVCGLPCGTGTLFLEVHVAIEFCQTVFRDFQKKQILYVIEPNCFSIAADVMEYGLGLFVIWLNCPFFKGLQPCWPHLFLCGDEQSSTSLICGLA